MAVNPSDEEGKPHIHEIVDGSCSIPVSCSSFKLIKQTIDEVDQHCSLDILPILFEEAPLQARFKCSFPSSHAQDVYSISMLPEEGKSLQCASLLAFLSFFKASNPSKSQMCMDAQLSCQNCIDLQANRAVAHPPCIIEIDIEKEHIKAPESELDTVESLKNEGILARVFRRQASLKVGGKLMQLLFNHGTSRDNPVTDKIHETPYNRSRRCRRTASFDSRKVVLLFSVLSSLGTLVLIYLTLRVRQSGDGFVHI